MRNFCLACFAFLALLPSLSADEGKSGDKNEGAGEPDSVVSIIGEVKEPQTLTLTAGMTLRDAIAATGGLTDFAGARRVKLIRGGDTSRHDLRDDAAEDPELKAGDIVSVPSGG
jgi:NADH:ubiquinone oxidoreductase subunit F (NADH-binding)